MKEYLKMAVGLGQMMSAYEPKKPIKRETKKVGRNEPCPCDSGKKYKKCCYLQNEI